MVLVKNSSSLSFPTKKIKEIARAVLKAFKVKKEVSVLLVDDKEIKALNKKYRGVNRVTNCLSFPQDDPFLLGDVVISLQRCQVRGGKNAFQKEVFQALIHSLLHLLGFEHKTQSQRKKMTAKAEEFQRWTEE